MAWVHTYGLCAPAAAGQIHWGATSCYVTDNADLILMRDGLDMLLKKMATAIDKLSAFAMQWKDQPCFGIIAFCYMVTAGVFLIYVLQLFSLMLL